MTNYTPYKYRDETKIISFHVLASVPEKGTHVRKRLYRDFKRLAAGELLSEKEINWLNAVLRPEKETKHYDEE